MFEADPINRLAAEFDPQAPKFCSVPVVDGSGEFVQRLLDRITSVHGGYSATTLSGLTHKAGSPLARTRERNPLALYTGILNDLIRSHLADSTQRSSQVR